MITTQRLDLVPATLESARAALRGRQDLAETLRVVVPDGWPPEYLDPPALQFIVDRILEDSRCAEWWMYFVILRGAPDRDRTLIGTVGYKGPPGRDGVVEVGYGIVREHQRGGYATEATQGLIARAFALSGIKSVVAHTLPSLHPSIGVLEKCGFRLIGPGEEEGTILFRLDRPPDPS